MDVCYLRIQSFHVEIAGAVQVCGALGFQCIRGQRAAGVGHEVAAAHRFGDFHSAIAPERQVAGLRGERGVPGPGGQRAAGSDGEVTGDPRAIDFGIFAGCKGEAIGVHLSGRYVFVCGNGEMGIRAHHMTCTGRVHRDAAFGCDIAAAYREEFLDSDALAFAISGDSDILRCVQFAGIDRVSRGDVDILLAVDFRNVHLTLALKRDIPFQRGNIPVIFRRCAIAGFECAAGSDSEAIVVNVCVVQLHISGAGDGIHGVRGAFGFPRVTH